MSRIAVIGGGIAGLTAAWQLNRLGQDVSLYEASGRLGGTVETIRRDGFIVELGPDGWVTEKPWAAELAQDLGLGEERIPSKDADRVTYILNQGVLAAMPDGMRMMVPTSLETLDNSPLFSAAAQEAYSAEPLRAAELRAAAPQEDESVAVFVQRHFGQEVLEKLAGPLLSGVFGGNVETLSVRAVMPAFVQMEREYGSLILALQDRSRRGQAPIFTTLATGTQTLIDGMAEALPASAVHLNSSILGFTSHGGGWMLKTAANTFECDRLVLATPAHVTCSLLTAADRSDAAALVEVEATSAVIAAFAFDSSFELPKGFGFLVPFSEPSPLLACTFVDQKFPHRVPAGKRLLRAFFGGEDAPAIAKLTDEQIAVLAMSELKKILGQLPTPLFSLIRRWPKSLPQYEVGHLERMAELEKLLPPNLHLLGNTYRGVGLPDLIRDARSLGRRLAS